LGPLRLAVLEYVSRVKDSPSVGSDPAELNALVRAARNSADGSFATDAAPIAPYRWEQRFQMASAQAVTDRIPFTFPFGIEVLGFIPTICALANPPGLLVPTLNDIDISIDVNAQQFITSTQGVSTPGGTQGGNFITLATIQIIQQALFRLQIVGVNPVMGFTLRWKRGINVYQDSIVGIGIVARPLRDIGTNVPAPGAGG